MSVRQVLKMGHPLLKKSAERVLDFNTLQLENLLQDMFDTMQSLDGAGLAAPQIGESLRVVIFGFRDNPRYPEAEAVPRTVLINPEIIPLGAEMVEGWEGCLSVPGMRGLVPRYQHIKYSGVDQHGEYLEREASGFHARVVQHEVDHLDGILYPQRIKDLTNFGFEPEINQLINGECDD